MFYFMFCSQTAAEPVPCQLPAWIKYPIAGASVLGLAVSPLFEQNEIADPTKHYVFLDGGYGTFKRFPSPMMK